MGPEVDTSMVIRPNIWLTSGYISPLIYCSAEELRSRRSQRLDGSA